MLLTIVNQDVLPHYNSSAMSTSFYASTVCGTAKYTVDVLIQAKNNPDFFVSIGTKKACDIGYTHHITHKNETPDLSGIFSSYNIMKTEPLSITVPLGNYPLSYERTFYNLGNTYRYTNRHEINLGLSDLIINNLTVIN